MDPFEGCRLYVSARSPFARRARVAFLETGFGYEEVTLDVWKPQAKLVALNPLGRVPVVELADGAVIVESSLILQELYQTRVSPLSPSRPKERREGIRWSGLALGACELLVCQFLERLRPETNRDPELLEECDGGISRFLEACEAELGTGESHLVGGRLTQADIDLAVALQYADFRWPLEWKARFPMTKRWLEGISGRESLKSTEPR